MSSKDQAHRRGRRGHNPKGVRCDGAVFGRDPARTTGWPRHTVRRRSDREWAGEWCADITRCVLVTAGDVDERSEGGGNVILWMTNFGRRNPYAVGRGGNVETVVGGLNFRIDMGDACPSRDIFLKSLLLPK